jgi:arylsulfatase A-like enzyme
VRRDLRGAVIFLALLLLGAGFLLFHRSRGTGHRPNIVVFVWDTCRADHLSAYGYPRPTTPRLEEFARDAVTFRHAYAPAPWTPPSHASLFTGLLPAHHGLTQREGEEAGRVRDGIPLLAETLAAAGYDTVGFTCNAFSGSSASPTSRHKTPWGPLEP